MTRAIKERIADAKEELRDWCKENPGTGHDWATNQIREIADGAVPVYHGDIAEVGASDLSLITSKPELGPAFDGEPTPVNIIAANIYERIQQELYEEWEVIKQEQEDTEDEDE